MTLHELVAQIKKKQSFLCVGLDTDLSKIPAYLLDTEDPIFEFNKAIIDATKEFCVAYKPNTAFYECYGPKGWESLKKTLDYHHQSGGTYSIATPSYIYTGCILSAMTDATGGESNQVQTAWRFDFVQPLITLEDAGAFSAFMQSLEGGLPIIGNPTWSGLLGEII